MKRDTVSEVFGALADPTRRSIYEQLLSYPSGRTATEIASSASISRQAIVRHLQLLTDAGLASWSREGREVRYVADLEGTAPASTWLKERNVAWDKRIAKLDSALQAKRPGATK